MEHFKQFPENLQIQLNRSTQSTIEMHFDSPYEF